MPGWQLWIDRGGTFTDIVALDPSGQLHTKKVLSNLPDQPDAAIAGIRQLLGLSDTDPIPQDELAEIKMGTTVATNAILEQHGAPVVLAITAGFSDALQIAYQNRPQLFALQIDLPTPLYKKVISVSERVDAQGRVMKALNKKMVRRDLKHAYKQGYRELAIVLMHSYLFVEHELEVAKIAEEIGFTQISVSHQVSPLMKIVSRGDTTVLDTYTTPTVQAYLKNLQVDLGSTPFYVMQSNGGLAAANVVQGKDSILSGPAAGVVGAVKSAATHADKIISFDMGGTSTDVAQFSGEYEYTAEAMVAGHRLHSPMLKIHTIAAGGGSIVAFKQGRYQVGPESAGAYPGPACYGHGGPLTLTDCNLMLGNIQPDFFPCTFGHDSRERLSKSIAIEKFTDLANEISRYTGKKCTPQQAAAGFVRVAVVNMSNAIKSISVTRGYDVTEYTLSCFGGAAAQHACMVANELHIERILMHPKAGVLSAWGLGLAELRKINERAVEEEFSASLMPKLNQIVADLAHAGQVDLLEQTNLPVSETAFAKIRIRYAGTDTPLSVDLASFTDMQAAFNRMHEQQFGYVMPDNMLIVESVAVEIVGQQKMNEKTFARLRRDGEALEPIADVAVRMQDAVHDTPVYAWDDLLAQDEIAGPALIIQPHSTIVVLQGWQAKLMLDQQLLLTRAVPFENKMKVAEQVDPVMLEVFNNLFTAIAQQMGAQLMKTAYSVNIKERLDFSCAIFDEQGDLVANAQHIPVHLGSMAASVRVVINECQTIQPGDVYMLNNPYHGGTHLPDVTVITPVFYKHSKSPIFYVASRAHHADIGGITPGSVPATSMRIEEEGVLIDLFHLVKDGRLQKDELLELLSSGPYPARNPQQNIADLRAQIAANQRGVYELIQLVEHYRLSVVQAYMQHVQDNAAECVHAVIDRLQDGEYKTVMDNGSVIQVAIHVNRTQRCATIDFSGTSIRRNNNCHAPRSVTLAAILYVFRLLVAENIPLNEGCLRPLNIVIPDDCLLNPKYPAAVVAGNVETSQYIVDTLLGAMGVMAESQGTMNNLTFGNDKYQYYETICGGAGAGSGFNGASAVHTHMTNTLMTDPEVLEQRFPVLVEEFSIRRGSGGIGHWQGGDGVVRRLRFLRAMTATIISNHRKKGPYGLVGGHSGQPGYNAVLRANHKEEKLGGTALVELQPGDQLVIKTPGGGGYGLPLSRIKSLLRRMKQFGSRGHWRVRRLRN